MKLLFKHNKCFVNEKNNKFEGKKILFINFTVQSLISNFYRKDIYISNT